MAASKATTLLEATSALERCYTLATFSGVMMVPQDLEAREVESRMGMVCENHILPHQCRGIRGKKAAVAREEKPSANRGKSGNRL